MLWFWECHGFKVLWVMLSTAPGGDASKLTYRHKVLRQRIEHHQVRTEEGHEVLHIFWAWRPALGEKARNFWIDQEWLSEQWAQIHGDSVVWIGAYRPSRKSRNRLSRYVISQYVQDQSGYVNICWSWKRSLGFPIGAVWNTLKGMWRNRNASRVLQGQVQLPWIILLQTWENLLAGHPILIADKVVQLVVGTGLVFLPIEEAGGTT